MMVALRNALVGNKKQESGYWGLCFTAEEANSTIVMSKKSGSPPARSFVVSYDDGNTWQSFDPNSDTITLANVGDKVCMGAAFGETYTQISTGARASRRFAITGAVAASGNIMSLLVNDKNAWQSIQMGSWCFYQLFYQCNVTSAPELPSMLLNTYCYRQMFTDCSLLTTMPSILPAQILPNNCYYLMFANCSSLVRAPEIASTTIAGSRCLGAMFNGCSSLSEVKVHFTEWARNIYQNTEFWLKDVSSIGTLHCPVELGTNETIQRDTTGSFCPEGWTVINDV